MSNETSEIILPVESDGRRAREMAAFAMEELKGARVESTFYDADGSLHLVYETGNDAAPLPFAPPGSVASTSLEQPPYRTEIIANGSTWAGQEPGTIEDLLEVLAAHRLDIRTFGVTYWEEVGAAGMVYFLGNFEDVSHVFRIETDDPELIARLQSAIRANLAEQPEAVESLMRYRCNRCQAEMRVTPIDGSGACRCGGLIEAHPDNLAVLREAGLLCDDLEGAAEDAAIPLPDLYNGEPVVEAYPHEAELPAPSGDQQRKYRYRIVEKPQGGRRVEAIFLTVGDGEPRWRAVKREETLEALEALAAWEPEGWRIFRTDPVPPIPGWEQHAWTFVHEDYDGPEDGRIGTAPSPGDCREQIREMEASRD